MYSIRINKYLTLANYCSRREADRLIERGVVKINNQKANLGAKVKKGDMVSVSGKEIRLENEEKVYLAFYKPVGIICTTDKRAKDNIIDFINYSQRIYPIGRLDVNTSGLILLTNDGSIVNKILKGQNKIEKEYIVEVDKELTLEFLNRLEKGIILDGYKTLPAKVKKYSAKKFNLILIQGKSHQIRRISEKLGYQVTRLIRIRIGKITLANLKIGEYKKFSLKEVIYE